MLGKSYDDLLTEHLKAIFDDCKRAFLSSREATYFSQEDMCKLIEQANIRITVPEIWTPDTCQRLQNAGKRAGMQLVTLASEAQRATAYLVWDEARKSSAMFPSASLLQGDVMMSVDIGCGTTDIITYRLEEDLSVRSQVEAIGASAGALQGSLQIDKILYQGWKSNKPVGWLKRQADGLKLSREEFERRAMLVIERIKTEFDYKASKTVKHGRIVGLDGKTTDIELTSAEIQAAFDRVIESNIELIEGQRSMVARQGEVVSAIQVTGGFSKSGYVRERLRCTYADKRIVVNFPDFASSGGQCYPILFGGLLRYQQIVQQKLPSKYGYTLLERQEFDPDKHDDSCSYEKQGRHTVIKHKPWVQHSPYDPSILVVDDLLAFVCLPGQEMGADFIYRRQQSFRLPRDEPSIQIQFVYTQNNRYGENDRAVKVNGAGFKAGIFPWVTINKILDAKVLARHEMKEIEVDDEEFWEVWGLVVVVNDGRMMHASLEILKPNEADPWAGEVAFAVTGELWDAQHSAFLE